MSITPDERHRISEAISAAEQRTSAEIVCVLAQNSIGSAMLPVLFAALAALALPWILVALTSLTVQRILLLQLSLFLILLVIACTPAVQVMLTPRRARRALAHRLAMDQFRQRGIARTKDRSGVLIFVSLAERYARIVADEGIARLVPQDEWQAVVNSLIGHLKEGRIAEGFIVAIDLCGDKLTRHFPRPPSDRDELQDRIYLI